MLVGLYVLGELFVVDQHLRLLVMDDELLLSADIEVEKRLHGVNDAWRFLFHVICSSNFLAFASNKYISVLLFYVHLIDFVLDLLC
jgi:hypothetical protein